MNHSPGKILLGIGTLAALATGGLVVFGPEVFGGGTPELATLPEGVDVSLDEPREKPTERVITGTVGDETVGSEDIAPLAGEAIGGIRGRIAISTRILDKLRGKKYQITVAEDLNPNAHRTEAPKPFKAWRRFPFDFTAGTPHFDFAGVPFSRHPYRVTVSVPAVGVDGSSAITHVNRQYPNGKDEVNLSISPGAIYSVMLRDQRRNPRQGLLVYMVPIDDTDVRRKWQSGATNNFGNVVFEDVQRGKYKICVGSVDAPMAPPKDVDVYAAMASVSRGKPHVQGSTVVVPDGRDVRVEVYTRYGAVLPQARIKAWQLEVKQYYEFKGETDRAGILVLENVPPGVYQLGIDATGHGRRDRKFEVDKDGQGPVLIKISM